MKRSHIIFGICAACIFVPAWSYYQTQPTLWLMPNLESSSALFRTVKALSPDDPATPDKPDPSSKGEQNSDRRIFLDWVWGVSANNRIPIPLTVGGAIDAQRAHIAQLAASAAEGARLRAVEDVRNKAEIEERELTAAAELEALNAERARLDQAHQACSAPYDAANGDYLANPSQEGGAAVTAAAGDMNRCLEQLAPPNIPHPQ